MDFREQIQAKIDEARKQRAMHPQPPSALHPMSVRIRALEEALEVFDQCDQVHALAKAEAELTHTKRKQQHGCTDAHCKKCDTPQCTRCGHLTYVHPVTQETACVWCGLITPAKEGA